MNVEFIPARSTTRDTNICEVWIDGKMVATITPSDHHGIRVISRWTLAPVMTADLGDGVKCSQVEFNVAVHSRR